MKTWGRVSLIVSVCLLAAGCGGDDDDTTVVDGSVTTVDSSTVMPDASTSLANNTYALNGVVVSATPMCAGNVIAGSNSNRTGINFKFMNTPTAGTYTVITPTSTGQTPTRPTEVVMRYASDPAGGPQTNHMGQSGTVVVDLVGGKLHAVGMNIPSKEFTSMAAGTIAGNITCP